MRSSPLGNHDRPTKCVLSEPDKGGFRRRSEAAKLPVVNTNLRPEPATVPHGSVRPQSSSCRIAATPPRHELFEHGADVGVRGLAPTKPEAFAQAAVALTALVTDPARVRALQRVGFACFAPDEELLLSRWLKEVVFVMARHRLLFAWFDVVLLGDTLRATGVGEPVDRARHQPAVEPKGARLAEVAVRPTTGGWLAQCVVEA